MEEDLKEVEEVEKEKESKKIVEDGSVELRVSQAASSLPLTVTSNVQPTATSHVPPTRVRETRWWRGRWRMAQRISLQYRFKNREEKGMSEVRWEEGVNDWPEVNLTGVQSKLQGTIQRGPSSAIIHKEVPYETEDGRGPVGPPEISMEDSLGLVRPRPTRRTFFPSLTHRRATRGSDKASHADSLRPLGHNSSAAGRCSSATVLQVAPCDCEPYNTTTPSCSADCDPCNTCSDKREYPRDCPARPCCYGQFWITQTMADNCYKDLFVRATLREFFMYLLFLVCILLMSTGWFDPGSYHFANGLQRMMIQFQFEAPLGHCCKPFKSITTYDDFAKYMDTVWTGVIDGEVEFSTGNKKKLRLIDSCSFLLGGPRIRLIMVDNNSRCTSAPEMESWFDTCYGYYDKEREITAAASAPSGYVYKSDGGATYFGKFAVYGPGGFIKTGKDKPPDDWRIRAIFVTSLHYSPCVNEFVLVKLVFEIHPSGFFVPASYFYPLRMLWYVNTLDYIILGAQILTTFFIFWYLALMIRELVFFKWCFFRLPWCWFLLALVVVGLMWLITCVVVYFDTHSTLCPLLMDAYRSDKYYPEAEHLVLEHQLLNKFFAVFVFLSILLLLKYLQMFRFFYILALGVSNAFWKLVLSVFVLLLIVAAYAVFAFLAFGWQLEAFSSYSISFYTVLTMIHGCYNYTQMRLVEDDFGPFFFFLFIYVVIFVWMNFFFALLLDAYREAKCSNCLNSMFFLSDYIKCIKKKKRTCRDPCAERKMASYTCCFQLERNPSKEEQGHSLDIVKSKVDLMDATCSLLLGKLDSMVKGMPKDEE